MTPYLSIKQGKLPFLKQYKDMLDKSLVFHSTKTYIRTILNESWKLYLLITFN